MNATTCGARKRDGSLCSAMTGPDGRCVGHGERAIEARRRGGRHSAKSHRLLKALPPDLSGLWDRLIAWLSDVEAGSVTPQQATALSVLISRLLDLAKVAHELGTAQELQARIEALEQTQERQKARRR